MGWGGKHGEPRRFPHRTVKGGYFSACQRSSFHASAFVLVVLAFNGLLSLLTCFTAKPVVIALLLLAALVTSFMQRYGVVIDRSMIQNVFETD